MIWTTFWGLSNGRIYDVFSVHTSCILVLIFNNEQLFGPKAHSPGCWVGRARAEAKAPPGQDLQSPLLQASSVVCRAGPRPSAGVITWCWDSRTGFYRWFSIQMTKTNSYSSETPQHQAYKNLCHHVGLIQDFSTCPNAGDKFLLELYIAELFAICSIVKD